MGKQTKYQSRRATAEAATISSPSSTSTYPPLTAAFVDNESGGSIRKPGIKQARRCQNLAFLSIISLLAFGFIVDTSFGFNRGDPHRSVRYQSPLLQSIESSAVNFCQCLYICSFNFLSLWVCVVVLNPRCPRFQ